MVTRASAAEITEDVEQPLLSEESRRLAVHSDGFLQLDDDPAKSEVIQTDGFHETGVWQKHPEDLEGLEGLEAGISTLEIPSIFEGNVSVDTQSLLGQKGVTKGGKEEEEGLTSCEDAFLLDSALGGGGSGSGRSSGGKAWSGGSEGRSSRRRVTAASDNLESLDYEVLDSEWHHGQWQAMTQADRIFHTALRWLLVLLIGICTGLLAFFVNISVEAIGGAKFGLVFSHIKGQNFLGGFLVLAATNLGLVLVSTCLCNGIAMEAVGSGIPEVKGYLNGVSTPAVLSAKTLIVKALGSIAAVAGGLAVGKEGPLVHCGACIASILGRLSHRISARRDLSRPRKPRIQTANSFASLGLFFNNGSIKALRTPVWLHSDRGLRDLVTCGAASGVASAFLSPVGGVLFALEQVTSWWRNSLIWRIFFTNAVVAMVLRACISLCEGDRCGGSFGSRGFILFDRSKSRTDFGLLEVVPVALLGIVGGLLGGLFNHLNVKLCAFRKSKLHRHGAWVRVLEVLLISLLTSALRFYGPFLASCLPCPQDPDEGGDLPQGSFNCPSIVGTGDHKAFACPDGQYNDLASLVFTTNDDAIGNLFRTGSFGIFTYPSLLLSFTIYFLLATLTYGTAVPAGLFVPSILCGASYGRMAGMVMVTLFGPHRVGEGTYALLGAASFLGGSMRMTVSLSVILLELTGSLKLLPLVMVVLLVSKSVGDLFNRNIEDSHVDLKGIPYLPENCTHQDFTLFEEDGEEGEEVGAGVLSRVTADSKHQQQQQQQQQQQEQQQQKQKQLVTGMGCSFDAAAGISSPNSPSMTLQQTTPFPRSPTVTFVVTPAVTPSITSLAVTPLLVSSPSAALLSPRSPTTPSEAPQKGSPTTPSEAPQKGSPTTPSGTLTNPANPVSPRTNPFSPRGTTPLTSSTPASPRCTNPVSPRTSPFIPRGTAPFTPRTPRRRATAGDAVGAAASGVFSAGSAGAAAGVSAGAGTATAAGSAISAGVAAASGATSAGCLVALEGVTTVRRIIDTLRATQHNAFPVVDFLGGRQDTDTRERAGAGDEERAGEGASSRSSSGSSSTSVISSNSSSGSGSSSNSSIINAANASTTTTTNSTSSSSSSSSSKSVRTGDGLLRISNSGRVITPHDAQTPPSQRTTFYGLILRKHLLALLHSKKAFCTALPRHATNCTTPSDNHAIYPDEQRAEILQDFATSLVGELQVQDLEITPEEEGMFVDLHPYSNRSPYIVMEAMGMQKAYMLFRNLGLRHLCVVPKPTDVIGIITRKDFINAMSREMDAPENHCR